MEESKIGGLNELIVQGAKTKALWAPGQHDKLMNSKLLRSFTDVHIC